MGQMNCPNCNGVLYLSTDKTKMICEYCDSEFAVIDDISEGITEQNHEENLSLSEQLFDMRIEYLNEKTSETWNTLCILIDGDNNVAEYMEAINIIAKTDSTIATAIHQKETLQTAVKSITSQLTADEEPLFFINKGIFSKGKDGILLTDKCVFRITKKMIYKLALQDICSINATPKPLTYNEWQLNNDDNFNIGFTLDNKATSIFLGLICTLARDCHPENYTITVNNQATT